MLSKIVEFFKNLFSGLFGSSKKKQSHYESIPPEKPDVPQDASEVTTDTTSQVIVVSEEDPVVITKEEFKEEMEAATNPDNEDFSETPNDFDIEDDRIEEPELPEPPVVIPEVPIPPKPPKKEEEKPKRKGRYLWCLDNGHGKKTAGKRSPMLNGQQFFEYEFNRDIVKRISKALDKKGIKYFIVVPEVDTDNFLDGRVKRANNKKSNLPKIFVSVHANAFGRDDWAEPSGIETWHFHSSKTSQQIARIFQKHLIKNVPWQNRKLKSYPGRKQFYVLRETHMPAILTENGFYTNKEQCKLLMTDSIRQKIADAHIDAIIQIEKNGIHGRA